MSYLWVSWSLLILGLLCVVSKRNLIGILLGIELMLNAAALNFVTFARFNGGETNGQIFALFIVVVAAAETVVALAIILQFYRGSTSVDVDEARLLRN